MYQVVKVLNNNGIIATRLEDCKEFIFIGKGIGFQRKKEDCFEQIHNAKMYKLQENDIKEGPFNVINNVEPVYFDIANEIVLLAEKKFGGIDNGILLPLADHIAFSIERMKNKLMINNPFLEDIKALFYEEYEVASKAISIIKHYIGYTINEDEVGYITLHIHSALTQEHIASSMSVAIYVGKLIEQIEDKLGITLNKESLSYNRFMTHIKYMITRGLKGEKLQVDITDYVKAEFSESYEIAKEICGELSKEINHELSETEIGHLAIHIERVRVVENV